MAIPAVFHPFYLLGSFWGTLNSAPGIRVCIESSSSLIPPAYEIARPQVSQQSGGVIAFVGVTVIPMDTERVLPDYTVLVENGRITRLGPAKGIDIPAGSVQIDGRGKYLIPGLGDMHVHNIGLSRVERLHHGLFRSLAIGITTIRTLEGDPTPEQLQLVRHVLETAEIPTPRLYVSKLLPRSIRPDSVPAYVAWAKANGYDFIGPRFGLLGNPARVREDREAFDSMVTAAHRLGFRIAAHSHLLPFEAMLTIGTTGGSIEHPNVGYWDKLGLWESYKTVPYTPVTVPLEKVPTLAAQVQQAGVWMTPTLDCMERVHTHITGLPQLVKAQADAGVRLLLGGDDGGDVHDELTALVRAGLTPYQALAAGTRNVAEFLGLLDSSGTVSTGKRADLVLLYGNPVTDIRYTREPAGVMIDGRWLDRASLDQHLLAPPAEWFETVLRPDLGFLAGTQREQLQSHLQEIEVLLDSLPKASASDSVRVRQLVAERLSAMRGVLTSKQHVWSDPIIRVWLREQLRKGYRVTISDVSPTL